MPLAAWRENSSRHVASLRRIRLVFFIAPVSSTITGRDYPQWTDLRKYVAELPVTLQRLLPLREREPYSAALDIRFASETQPDPNPLLPYVRFRAAHFDRRPSARGRSGPPAGRIH